MLNPINHIEKGPNWGLFTIQKDNFLIESYNNIYRLKRILDL